MRGGIEEDAVVADVGRFDAGGDGGGDRGVDFDVFLQAGGADEYGLGEAAGWRRGGGHGDGRDERDGPCWRELFGT